MIFVLVSLSRGFLGTDCWGLVWGVIADHVLLCKRYKILSGMLSLFHTLKPASKVFEAGFCFFNYSVKWFSGHRVIATVSTLFFPRVGNYRANSSPVGGKRTATSLQLKADRVDIQCCCKNWRLWHRNRAG